MEKQFKGKAIYSPSGKAGEYAQWACNFYVGCSNGCTYCYLKKGRCKAIMGGDVPTLKKCFKDVFHALEVFRKELKQNLPELQKHGLFFSFTTDPLLKETAGLTLEAVQYCNKKKVPVKILTKKTDLIFSFLANSIYFDWNLIAFGFTLTGHDELEPGASPNAERIIAMKKLHDAGFKTFASIEPVVDFMSSLDMINKSFGYCDLYKIGLMSGKKVGSKDYKAAIKESFILSIAHRANLYSAKIYFKDSLLKEFGIERESLPFHCVTRDYNIFE